MGKHYRSFSQEIILRRDKSSLVSTNPELPTPNSELGTNDY